MKKLSLLLVVAFMSTLILDSCSVQKRYHRKGFNVNWNHTSIGGKKDKNKVAYDSSEEEIAEVTEVKATENVVKNEMSAYSNEATSDLASTTDEISVVTSLPAENKFVEKKSTEKQVENKIINGSKKMLKKIIPSVKAKNQVKTNSNNSSDVPIVLLYILCFIFPPVAVGLATDWDLTPVLWNIVWCVLCGLPGVIHALIHVSRNR